jgi:hypothetical protein
MPYFMPGDGGALLVGETVPTVASASGQPATHAIEAPTGAVYVVVKAIGGFELSSAPSNRVGAFSFSLTPDVVSSR